MRSSIGLSAALVAGALLVLDAAPQAAAAAVKEHGVANPVLHKRQGSGSGQYAGESWQDRLARERAEASASFSWTGSDSFYWHNRYHGILAMSAYGDYEMHCPRTFTAATLQRQYPGNTNNPFEVVGKWGPTPVYKSEGYMVRVPEMNKILMVFKGQYGFQKYPSHLSPFYGIGCNSTCMAHTGALEAWYEVKNVTNDMQAIKSHQDNLVWSATGHGFGGMIAQVAALDLKARGFAFSCHSFGSPAVFNEAAATRWNDLFLGDASQRTVANEDSIPTTIPVGYNVTTGITSNYTFVNTGVHVFGTSAMYGQDFYVCQDAPTDPRCMGGANEADHYFYYTDIGYCGDSWDDTKNNSMNNAALASDRAAYSATATEALPFVANTTISTSAEPTTSTTASNTSSVETSTAAPTSTASPINAAAADASASTESTGAASPTHATLAAGTVALVSAALVLLV